MSRNNPIVRSSLPLICVVLSISLVACDVNTIVPKTTPAATPPLEETSSAAAVPPPVEVKLNWNWLQKSPEGWMFGKEVPETFWPDSGGFGLKAPAENEYPDVFVRSPPLNIPGSQYTKVLVDIECLVPAERNDLNLYYTTEGHAESSEFRMQPIDGTPLVAGERRTLVYDALTRLPAGGSDWTSSSIIRIRFDLPQGANSEYIIHSIRVCSVNATDCG